MTERIAGKQKGGAHREQPRLADDAGFSLLETLVAMIFMGIISLAITSMTTVALRTEKHTEVHFAASVLASDRMEQLLATDAVDLDSSFDETDTPVAFTDLNINFLRTTTVTINADDTRTITVAITADNSLFPVDVSFTSTLALWE